MSKKEDVFAHSCLYLALTVGVIAVVISRFDPIRQFLVLMLIVVFYLIWGFAYHHYKKDATTKLFIEYLLISAIALGAGYLVLVG